MKLTRTYVEKNVSERERAGQKMVVRLGLAARSATIFGLARERQFGYANS